MTEKQPPSYPLRMPQELREQLTDVAKKSGRSVNAEIVARLEQSFAAPAQESGEALSQTVRELESLQRLGTLNYQLERATYKVELIRGRMEMAWKELQFSIQSAPLEHQTEARAVFDELRRELEHHKSTVERVEAEISAIHLERKVTGLKELRDVEPIYASVRGGPLEDTGVVLHDARAKKPPMAPATSSVETVINMADMDLQVTPSGGLYSDPVKTEIKRRKRETKGNR